MKKIYSTLLILLSFSSFSITQGSVIDSILNKISADSLKLYNRQLSGDTSCTIGGASYTILSRHKLQPGNDKAAQYILEKFQSFGLTTQYETFSITGKNVIGTKLGTQFPNQYYVICAHFDDMPTGTTAPGADDNASGTAAVIELARVLSQYNFQYTIKFIGFDEEEQGLIGSAYYATQAKARNDSILAVINLDMIAWDSNNDNNIDIHSKSVANTPQIAADFVDNIATYNIGLVPQIVASQPYSDHASFLTKGYGAILVIEDDGDFHPYYHTVNDKFIYVNLPYFHKMTKAAGVTIAKYALNLKIVLEHTPIASSNFVCPETAYVNVFSELTIGSGAVAPRLYYRVNYGSGFSPFNVVLDADGLVGSQYNFIIPPQPLGSIVEYYVAVQDQAGSLVETLPAGGNGTNPPGSTPPTQLYRYFIANQVFAFTDNCGSMTRWNSASQWGTTTSSFVSEPASFTDSPGGTYANSTINILTVLDTVIVQNGLYANLQYYAKWDLESGYDYVQAMITTNFGTTWTPLAGKYTKLGSGGFQPDGQPLYNGTQSAWVLEEIDLSSYFNMNIQLRFYFISDGSLTADGFYVDDIKVIVYQSGGEIVSTNISTNEGWNLVSVPISIPDNRATAIFLQAASQVFGYDKSYSPVNTLTVGKAYWVKFNEAQNHSFSGYRITNLALPVTKGWNLVGSLNNNIPVSTISVAPLEIISSPFIAYNSGYYSVDTLRRGEGYWLNVTKDGMVYLNSTVQSGSIKNVQYKTDFKNILTFIDNSGNRTQLYLSEPTDGDYFDELPPTPPSGVFDVRFSNNKTVGLLSETNTILLNSVNFPVEIKFDGEKSTSLALYPDDSKIPVILSSSNSVVLTQPVSQVQIKSTGQPTEYGLSQNYPNPFNPFTIITFQLPVDNFVTLKVYNVLGQEVATLVDEFKKMGSYEVVWNAAGFSSGMYFYKLASGSHTSLKKMLLLR